MKKDEFKFVISYDGSPIAFVEGAAGKLPTDVLRWYAFTYSFPYNKLQWSAIGTVVVPPNLNLSGDKLECSTIGTVVVPPNLSADATLADRIDEVERQVVCHIERLTDRINKIEYQLGQD